MNTKMYRLLAEITMDAIFIHDFDGRFVEVNAQACKSLGYSREECLKLSIADVSKNYDLEGIHAVLEQAKTTGVMLEDVCLRKDGSTFPVEVRVGVIADEEELLLLSLVHDITDHKQLEEELRKEVAFSKSLVDTAQVIVLVLDVEGRILQFNPYMEEISGYKLTEVKGKDWCDTFLPVEDHSKIRALFQKAVSDIQVLGNVNPILTKGGYERQIEWYNRSLKDTYGNVVGVLAIGQDITERKQAEESRVQLNEHLDLKNQELHETNEYLANLIGYASAPIIVWNPNTIITRFNHAFEHLTGYKADEVIGEDLEILFPRTSRDNSMNAIRRTVGGEYWESVEIPILRKDGEVRVALWNSANINAEDGKTLIATIAQGIDITERKQAEETLTSLNDQLDLKNQELHETNEYLANLIGYASAPIIVWNPNTIITRFNHAFEHLTGYKADEVIGEDLEILFPRTSRDNSMNAIRRTVGGEYWESVEIPILRKDGEVRVALWNSANINAEDGKTLIATIAQGIDITERKQAEETLTSLNDQLDAKNKELEQVIGVTSHDLRSPLVSIEGFSGLLGTYLEEILDILDKEGFSSEIKEKLDPIIDLSRELIDYVSKGVVRMDLLLSGLSQVSRLGRVEVKTEELDMNALMSDVLSVFKFKSEEQGAKIELSELPPCSGDAGQINQLFANLIGNALKYTDPDRPCIIKVSGQREGAHLVYCVEDNGIGISSESEEKIFGIFHQLNPETAGEGLGLSIAHKIVERHNGRIWVESEPGQGSRFYVSL